MFALALIRHVYVHVSGSRSYKTTQIIFLKYTWVWHSVQDKKLLASVYIIGIKFVLGKLNLWSS
jgi:hypothetical protein